MIGLITHHRIRMCVQEQCKKGLTIQCLGKDDEGCQKDKEGNQYGAFIVPKELKQPPDGNGVIYLCPAAKRCYWIAILHEAAHLCGWGHDYKSNSWPNDKNLWHRPNIGIPIDLSRIGCGEVEVTGI